MSLQTVATQFVELCRQGKNFEVMRTMYAPDIVSVEGDGRETAGRTPVIQKSERWVANNDFHGETVQGPFFSGDGKSGGQFAPASPVLVHSPMLNSLGAHARSAGTGKSGLAR